MTQPIQRTQEDLLIEDLQHAQNIDGVEVVNPFRTTPEQIGLIE